MESTELKRVQNDLELMKATIGREFPYDRRHVLMCLLVAGAGIIGFLIAVPQWQSVMRSVLVVYFCCVVAVWYWQVRQVKSERSTRPRAWYWTRRETSASLLAIALLIPYVLMIRLLIGERSGWDFPAWRDYVAGPVMFFVGVAVSCICITTPERRAGLGWGLAAILAGLAVPWCESYSQTMLVLGAAMTFGGLASAAILYRQILQAEAADVAD